jgi:mono/diheme cytochrome c family protein
MHWNPMIFLGEARTMKHGNNQGRVPPTAGLLGALTLSLSVVVAAAVPRFHNAPESADQLKNPYAHHSAAAKAGATLFTQNCSACHGANGQGMANIPAVRTGPTQSAPDGQLFWFITTGEPDKGMPAWGSLTEQQRWQVVTYLKSLSSSRASR